MKKYLNRLIFYTFLHLQMDADPDQTYHFDPDPAYHFDADADPDPDPAFQFDADASGSTTLVLKGNSIIFWYRTKQSLTDFVLHVPSLP
jgi:hypothetical protein